MTPAKPVPELPPYDPIQDLAEIRMTNRDELSNWAFLLVITYNGWWPPREVQVCMRGAVVIAVDRARQELALERCTILRRLAEAMDQAGWAKNF
jgi:hypothetical protein